jgi:hypothetical protein
MTVPYLQPYKTSTVYTTQTIISTVLFLADLIPFDLPVLSRVNFGDIYLEKQYVL